MTTRGIGSHVRQSADPHQHEIPDVDADVDARPRKVAPADLALAAARTRALAEQIPTAARDVVIGEWSDLLADLEDARSAGAAELVLIEYRRRVEERLATRQLHAPLETSR